MRSGTGGPITRPLPATFMHNAHLGAVAERPTVELLNDQVLIKLIHPERMTSSHRLWIPDSAKRQAYEVWKGEVIAVGPGYRPVCKQPVNEVAQPTAILSETLIKPDVKPGDVVQFYFAAGVAATRYPDDEHVIISEDCIQVVFDAE